MGAAGDCGPTLAAMGLIWFVVGLALLLARAEGNPPWRSGVALVSGVLLAAYLLLDVSWDAASYGAAYLDPAVASFAFDLGNLGFANIWLAMGSFAICAGWVVLSTVHGWAVRSGRDRRPCRWTETVDDDHRERWRTDCGSKITTVSLE